MHWFTSWLPSSLAGETFHTSFGPDFPAPLQNCTVPSVSCVIQLLLCCHHPISPTVHLCALCCHRAVSPPPCSFVTASPASWSWAALSEIAGMQHDPAAGCRQSRYPQLARLSRRASKAAWDVSAPDCLSGWEKCCHSAASTPSPDQMFCGSALIWSELCCKLYFCVSFWSASSSGSVIFIHQFLF